MVVCIFSDGGGGGGGGGRGIGRSYGGGLLSEFQSMTSSFAHDLISTMLFSSMILLFKVFEIPFTHFVEQVLYWKKIWVWYISLKSREVI